MGKASWPVETESSNADNTEQITTLLFDCDNTLVLSESLAFEACADLANEILESKGFEERYTGPQLLDEFVGQNFRGMMTSLQKKYGYSMSDEELNKYVTSEEDAVIAKLKAALVPCEGIDKELADLAASGKYHMAVVSSSALRRVQASIDKVGQAHYFGKDVFSAATSLEKPTSKPDPAIYLHAMKVLGKKADECVAIEDSKSGATSANRAGIPTVGYVGSYPEHEHEKMMKVLKEAGCGVIMTEWHQFPAMLEKLEKQTANL